MDQWMDGINEKDSSQFQFLIYGLFFPLFTIKKNRESRGKQFGTKIPSFVRYFSISN